MRRDFFGMTFPSFNEDFEWHGLDRQLFLALCLAFLLFWLILFHATFANNEIYLLLTIHRGISEHQ